MLSTASYVAAEQVADRRADAIAFHAASQAASTAATSHEDVVLRRSTSHDAAALARLAQLDGAPRPVGAVLVAELEGEIVAAVPVEGGRAIADPFRPTAELVELLNTRALGNAAPVRRLPRLRPHLRPRIAA
jgi:hypothetical protein